MRIRSSTALCFLCLFLLQCGTTPFTAPDSGPIRIGFFADLSGSTAPEGNDALLGVRLQIDTVNASGGVNGRRIELLTQDIGQSPAEAVRAYTHFAQDENVSAVIGTALSSVCLAVSPVAELAKVPFISHCMDDRVTLPELRPDDPTTPGSVRSFSFLSQPTALQTGFIAASYLIETFAKSRPAILYPPEDTVTVIQAKAFEYYAKKRGLRIAASLPFIRGSTDFQTPLTQIATARADSLFIVGNETECAAAAVQADAKGIGGIVIGNASWASPLPRAGTVLPPIYLAQNISMDDPRCVQFIDRYIKAFSLMPRPASVSGGDDILLLIAAIRKAGSSAPGAIRDALERISGVQCTAGTVSMDPRTHRPAGPSMAVMRLDEGVVKTILPVFVAKELK
jgi:branched-chain amino acid transport system substrate-binding protein